MYTLFFHLFCTQRDIDGSIVEMGQAKTSLPFSASMTQLTNTIFPFYNHLFPVNKCPITGQNVVCVYSTHSPLLQHTPPNLYTVQCTYVHMYVQCIISIYFLNFVSTLEFERDSPVIFLPQLILLLSKNFFQEPDLHCTRRIFFAMHTLRQICRLHH